MEHEFLSIIYNKIDNKIKALLTKLIELDRDGILKVEQMFEHFGEELRNLLYSSNNNKMEPEEAYKTLRSIFLEMGFSEKETDDLLSQIMLLNKDSLTEFLKSLMFVFFIIAVKIDSFLEKIPDNEG